MDVVGFLKKKKKSANNVKSFQQTPWLVSYSLYSRELKSSSDQAVILYYKFNTSADAKNVQDRFVNIIENNLLLFGLKLISSFAHFNKLF